MTNTTRPPLTKAAARPADGDPELDVFRCPLDGIHLVEASAGTGKTWAICGLVLRLLLERGLGIEQVLVVTFTEAATAELRERIRGRLAEVLAALQPGAPRPADPFVVGLLGRLRQQAGFDEATLVQRLQAALHGFDEAAIHTIHGWCQRALADTPFSAGLPMQQEVLLDDSELRDAAVRQAWREDVSQRPLPAALAALLLARNDTPQAWSSLLRRLLGARSPNAAGRRRSRAWTRCPGPTRRRCSAPTRRSRSAGPPSARRSSTGCTTRWCAPTSRATSTSPRASRSPAAVWDGLLSGDDPLAPLDKDALAKAQLFTSDKLASGTKAGRSAPQHPFYDEAGAWLAQRGDAERQLGLARAWLMRRVLERAEAALRRRKRAEGLVAFDDMLFNLHQALHDPARPQRGLALASALRARFPAALVDEFQDTDPLQFAIFRRLYGRPPRPTWRMRRATRPRPRCSSSATRSRRSTASAMPTCRPTWRHARSPTRPIASPTTSVRCRRLVEGLNRLFGQHARPFMQEGLAYRPVGIGPKRRSELIDHSAAADPASHAALQLWRIADDPDDGLPPLRATAHAQALEATAAEIARLLGEARHARITLGGRPLRAGDIAVLVRSHRHGGEVRQALAARGIGSVELSQASVYRSPDAEELAWVLAAVLQPGRDRLLRAALATELFGRRASDLDAAAQAPDGLMDDMQRFADHAALWRERGIAVMLRRMMAVEQIAARLLRHPQGERRLTNWLHLAECLHEAEATHRAPAALLRWFERQRSDEAITEASQLRLESDQNLVQIVTVHKSKGLEYPFVFCPFLWTPMPMAPPGSELLAYPDTGDAGPTMVLDFRARLDDDCDPKALRQRIALDTAAEELRLVYVALTRAVHRCMLVVGCSARSNGRGGRSPKAGTTTPLNWLVAGDGVAPADWLAGGAVDAATVMGAWLALAQGGGAQPPGPPPVSLRGLDEVLAQAADAPPAPAHEPPPLQALPPPARVPAGWSIGSYSQLSRGSAPAGVAAAPFDDSTDAAAVDHDAQAAPIGDGAGSDDEAQAATAPSTGRHDSPDNGGAGSIGHVLAGDPARRVVGEASPAWAADDILRFPRGGSAGECIHRVFERADFTQPAQWPAVVDQALAALPGTDAGNRPARAAMLLRMLREVCAAQLLPAAGGQAAWRLGELASDRRLNELEFHLPAPTLTAAALNAELTRLGYPVPPLAFGQLQGWLRGFIDLVFEHAGRWYVLDWKSNHLGPGAADYTPAACARAMAVQGYHLQALVYALALSRLLALRLSGYRHDQHFGGVAHVFVRGLRPGWTDADGRPCGLHFDRPSAETLQRLAAVFDGDTR